MARFVDAKIRASDKDLPVPNVIFKCSLIKTYTTEDSLLIFLLEKTTFEEYEKPIYFATNRDFVINKILPKYVCTFSVQKDTYLNIFITGKWFKLLGNYRHNLLISSVVEFLALGTGKSLSEALIFASINPQYDNRLFMELP